MRSVIIVVCTLLLCGTMASAKWDSLNFKAETQKLVDALTQNDDAAIKNMWNSWKQEFGKSNEAGIDGRYAIFKDNLKTIAAINEKNAQAGASWFAAPNAQSHLSPAEWAAGYLGLDPSLNKDSHAQANAQSGGNRKLLGLFGTAPATTSTNTGTVDWVASGKTTPIKDQAGCGSCWAFAVNGAMESKALIVNSTTLDLSEQQLVDCDTNDYGCDGGWPASAFSYIAGIAGLTKEANYPYTAATGTCQTASIKTPLYKVAGSGYTTVTANSQAALKQAVATAPVVIAWNAESTFQNYGGGIYNPATCDTTTVNHALVVVGYNTTGGYWKVRNSWGTGWGEAGYARVAMAPDGPGLCGMYNWAWAPTTVTTPKTSTGLFG